jgi:hypothetical protein
MRSYRRCASDNATLDELLVSIKTELTTLAPLIGLEVVTSPQVLRTEGRGWLERG